MNDAFQSVLLAFLCLMSTAACHKHAEQSGNLGEPETLQMQFENKLADLARIQDETTGWPTVSDCDGLLWAGLAAAAGAQVNLAAAELAPGEMHRRPVPCWTKDDGDQGSKSTISQDMLIGYLWGLWRKHDLPALQRLANYGEKHEQRAGKALIGWIMGEPYPEELPRVFSRLNMVGMVGRMLFELSAGKDGRSYRTEPSLYLPVAADYERHVQVLSIVLEGELTGHAAHADLVSINEQMLARLREYVEASPRDGLFQAALAVYTGDFTKANELLTAEGYELPSYVRGDGAYGLVHWLFAAHLVLKYNNGPTQ